MAWFILGHSGRHADTRRLWRRWYGWYGWYGWYRRGCTFGRRRRKQRRWDNTLLNLDYACHSHARFGNDRQSHRYGYLFRWHYSRCHQSIRLGLSGVSCSERWPHDRRSNRCCGWDNHDHGLAERSYITGSKHYRSSATCSDWSSGHVRYESSDLVLDTGNGRNLLQHLLGYGGRDHFRFHQNYRRNFTLCPYRTFCRQYLLLPCQRRKLEWRNTVL